MPDSQRKRWCWISCSLVILLASCGYNRTLGQTLLIAEPEVTTLQATMQAVPRVRGSSPSTESVPTSRVFIETDQQKYERDQEVTVTISNDLDTSVTTFDQQAFCSIVRLEQQSGAEWKELKNCIISGPPSRLVTLQPRTKTTVKLPSITPGTYRVSLIYSLGEAFHFGNSFAASSTPFYVQ
jgi:hypothetical protein